MSEAAVISRRIPPESLPDSSGRVLVIDDEAEIRESLETLLQLEGYNVSTAATGREGLAQLGERLFVGPGTGGVIDGLPVLIKHGQG